MSIVLAKDVWQDVARVCGLPRDGVKRAVVTFDVDEPVTAEIDMFAFSPDKPSASVWGTVGAGSAPFDTETA
jgi:hypothetical protein